MLLCILFVSDFYMQRSFVIYAMRITVKCISDRSTIIRMHLRIYKNISEIPISLRYSTFIIRIKNKYFVTKHG